MSIALFLNCGIENVAFNKFSWNYRIKTKLCADNFALCQRFDNVLPQYKNYSEAEVLLNEGLMLASYSSCSNYMMTLCKNKIVLTVLCDGRILVFLFYIFLFVF